MAANRFLQYIRSGLSALVGRFRGEGPLHECNYRGCTELTRYPYCEEHHALQRQFVEKYHYWDKFKNDPNVEKNIVAKTELIQRERYEYLFNLPGDRGHEQWKDFLVTHVTNEDIQEIINYINAENDGYNVDYYHAKLRARGVEE
ncbi:hypothetical protein WDU94_007362 [Cyamophila willieti]